MCTSTDGHCPVVPAFPVRSFSLSGCDGEPEDGGLDPGAMFVKNLFIKWRGMICGRNIGATLYVAIHEWSHLENLLYMVTNRYDRRKLLLQWRDARIHYMVCDGILILVGECYV